MKLATIPLGQHATIEGQRVQVTNIGPKTVYVRAMVRVLGRLVQTHPFPLPADTEAEP